MGYRDATMFKEGLKVRQAMKKWANVKYVLALVAEYRACDGKTRGGKVRWLRVVKVWQPDPSLGSGHCFETRRYRVLISRYYHPSLPLPTFADRTYLAREYNIAKAAKAWPPSKHVIRNLGQVSASANSYHESCEYHVRSRERGSE